MTVSYRQQQKHDEDCGRKAYAAGYPYLSTKSGAWRRGWRSAQRRDRGRLITPQDILADERRMLARMERRYD